jgi:hypothetical protein
MVKIGLLFTCVSLSNNISSSQIGTDSAARLSPSPSLLLKILIMRVHVELRDSFVLYHPGVRM